MKTRAAALSASLFAQETLLAAAVWAFSIKCNSLFNSCSRIFCRNASLQFNENDTLCLSSLEAKPLQMLQAVGADLSSLYIQINFENDTKSIAFSWRQVVEACPALYTLDLRLTGKVPDLEFFHLAELKELKNLVLHGLDVAAFESLRALKFPEKMGRIHIFLKIDLLRAVSFEAFQFFRNLPSRGVLLNLDLVRREVSEQKGLLARMWGYLESDPLNSLFSNLRHCEKLEVDSGKSDCLAQIIEQNKNEIATETINVSGDTELRVVSSKLQELRIEYTDRCPLAGDLQTLFREVPNLKKCHIRIHFHCASEARNGIKHYLQEVVDGFKNSVTIELSGSYKQELDQIVKNNKPDAERKEGTKLAFAIHFFPI